MRQSMHVRARAARLAVGCVMTLVLGTAAACGGPGDGETVVGLITKTDTNPFFVKMKEGAQQAAGQARGRPADASPASRTATTRPRCRRSRT